MFDYLVIGKGLIGSAAARYLSQQDAEVGLIGIDPPSDWSSHSGVFASHYDSNRVFKLGCEDRIHSFLAEKSLSVFNEISASSDKRFFNPVGFLQVSHTDTQPLHNEENRSVELSNSDLQEQFKYFSFPSSLVGRLETETAGYINPLKLVEAQLAIAKSQGLIRINAEVETVKLCTNFVEVTDKLGEKYRTKKVLLAAGAYTNFLVDKKLPFKTKFWTVASHEISDDDAQKLEGMPVFDWDPIMWGFPPTLQDGRWILKLTTCSTLLESYEDVTYDQITSWFLKGGSQAYADQARSLISTFLPDITVLESWTKPCVSLHTESGYPLIDQLEPNLFVAAGGCASSAKFSNELGRLAAELTKHGSWQDKQLDHNYFRKTSD